MSSEKKKKEIRKIPGHHAIHDADNIKFDFVNHRKIFFWISTIIIVIGVIVLFWKQMNFGVDFKAGTSMDINVGQSITQEQAKDVFAKSAVDPQPAAVSVGGEGNQRISARFDKDLPDADIKKIQAAFKEAYGDKVSQEVNTVSPEIAQEMGIKAIIAVLIASVFISIYVSIRFEWRFALVAIIAILHDAMIVICMFAIFRFEVDLPFVAAVMTTVGYSINDKIVIFDRIRENMRFSKLKTEQDVVYLVNHSIWSTMARSINTVVTVLFAALCLFIFGSESIKLFALAKLIGLASGAYSSICIASPLWFMFKRKSLGSKPKVASVKQ